ncbi:MAG: tetratricopeptide repeat protein, partial [candidate division Zixibacteria bacterium]
MSRCIDEQIGKKLHLYELGLLKENETEQFELHLFECDACLESVTEFKKVARHLNLSDKVRSEVAEISGERKTVAAKRKVWPLFVPTSIVAAAVLAFLILKPFELEFKPTKEAVAAEDRLAIIHFSDITRPDDQDRLGEVVANLLITDLSESPHLRVVSARQLDEILLRLGSDSLWPLPKSLAGQLARESGAHWMLTGDIIQHEPKLVLSSQLTEVATGTVVAAQRITAQEGDDIFSLVDRLSLEIRTDLELPTMYAVGEDRSVADVTTHSTSAYRHYLAGIRHFVRFYQAEARESFEKAIEADSTFAMAYYYLAQLGDRSSIDKAMQYAEQSPAKEQLYIRSLKAAYDRDRETQLSELGKLIDRFPDEKRAYFLMGSVEHDRGNWSVAAGFLNRAIEIDPFYKSAYNRMAYLYSDSGDFVKAIWAIDKYISISPEEANPYDTRGELLARSGDLKGAIASYERALEIKPDFLNSLVAVGNLYVFDGRFADAEHSYLEDTRLSTGEISPGRMRDLANIPTYHGQFAMAVSLIDSLYSDYLSNRESNIPVSNLAAILHYKARLVRVMGDYGSALNMIEECIDAHRRIYPSDRVTFEYLQVQLLAENGMFDQAEEIVADLDSLLPVEGGARRYYWTCAGILELVRGNYEQAVTLLQMAHDDRSTGRDVPLHFRLGKAYLLAGYRDKAV